MKKRIRLSESQLHRVIKEAVLDELDWRTYDNAINRMEDASEKLRGDDIDEKDLSDPDVRWCIIKCLSKKYGKKNVKPFIESLTNKQLLSFLHEIDRDGLTIWAEIQDILDGEENDGMLQARSKSFGDKFGFKPRGNKYSGIDDTDLLDKEGNVWNLKHGEIYDPKSEEEIRHEDYTIYPHVNPFAPGYKRRRHSEWNVPYTDDEDVNKRLWKASKSEAGQEIINQRNGNYEYVKGKGYKLNNESLIRRVTENVIRKLNEGIYDELKEDYDTRNLVLLIDNDEECQKQVQWVVQALVKKVRRGLVPELDYLADCYTVREILQRGMRKLKAQAKKYETPMPYLDNGQKRQVRLYIAQSILDDVAYETNNSAE